MKAIRNESRGTWVCFPFINGKRTTRKLGNLNELTQAQADVNALEMLRSMRLLAERIAPSVDNVVKQYHSFRHTFRSWLDAVGTALTVQQKLMRHADIQTTLNIYGDVVTDEMRQAGSKVAERALKSDSRLIPVLANN